MKSDVLMGLDKLNAAPKTKDNRLYRRLSQLEKLPAKERKQIVQLLDTYLEREKLRKPPQQLKAGKRPL